ncbi:Kinase [Hexamita inflata]|uniref:non-specific serine/threonine protein kinase n=1 Tax=Hexamita inflata TaxID=28002 RepID=A0ABP1HDZ4_9EUKA
MLSKFQYIKLLGIGGFGTVIKVQRQKDQKIYAMKEIHGSNGLFSEQQLDEVRFLASFCHSNILTYYESFIQANKLYIIMEYADKGDLYSEIIKRAKLKQYYSEEEIVNILIQCVNGLNYLHSKNIIHRDIKDSNILLFKNSFGMPICKIADFGMSQASNSSRKQQAGTYQFMAPEIWKYQLYTDKTDVFALGVVLYELCTFTVPFDGQKDVIKNNVINGSFTQINDNRYSTELKELIHSMLSRKAIRRPSAQQILNQTLVQQFSDYYPNIQIEIPNQTFVNNQLPQNAYMSRNQFLLQLQKQYQELNDIQYQITNIQQQLEYQLTQLPCVQIAQYQIFDRLYEQFLKICSKTNRQILVKMLRVRNYFNTKIRDQLSKCRFTFQKTNYLIQLKIMAIHVPALYEQINQNIVDAINSMIKDNNSIPYIVLSLVSNTNIYEAFLIIEEHCLLKHYLNDSKTLQIIVNTFKLIH